MIPRLAFGLVLLALAWALVVALREERAELFPWGAMAAVAWAATLGLSFAAWRWWPGLWMPAGGGEALTLWLVMARRY